MSPTPTRAELLVAAALAYLDIELPQRLLDESADEELARWADRGRVSTHDALDRARALLGDGWQPIETAPKDGTTIQLWSEYMSEPCTGAWGTQRHGRLGWNAKHDGMWVVESEHDLSGTTYKEISVATHYMPLPAPPSSGASDV